MCAILTAGCCEQVLCICPFYQMFQFGIDTRVMLLCSWNANYVGRVVSAGNRYYVYA